MGINVSYRSNVNCGQEHIMARGCPREHIVLAEWARTDVCRIVVDEQEIRVPADLFGAVLEAMKRVVE